MGSAGSGEPIMSNVSIRGNIIRNAGSVKHQKHTSAQSVDTPRLDKNVDAPDISATPPALPPVVTLLQTPATQSPELQAPHSGSFSRATLEINVPKNIGAAQQALTVAGFAVALSGDWGEISQSALRAFQASAGIQVSGEWDAQTEQHLQWAGVMRGQTALKVGDRGPAVERLQAMLQTHSQVELHGEFDETTQKAVEAFQKHYPNLQQDGVVSSDTAQALEISQLRVGLSQLRSGYRGPVVARVQKALERLGYRAGLNGIYGASTTRAVRSFQREHGVSSTGVVDAQTFETLEKAIQDGRRGRKMAETGPGLEVFPLVGEDFQLGYSTEAVEHAGVDVFAPVGTRVIAPVSGVVSNIRRQAEDGFPSVTIRRGEHYFSLQHLGSVARALRVGLPLRAGEKIGTVGVPADGTPTDSKIRFTIQQNRNGAEMILISAFRHLMNKL